MEVQSKVMLQRGRGNQRVDILNGPGSIQWTQVVTPIFCRRTDSFGLGQMCPG